MPRPSPASWKATRTAALKKVRPYTLEYRAQVEGDIAKASVDFIQRQAKAKQPFFLYVGFTHTHYPTRTAPEFTGKSRIGVYGDAIMELDHRTGQVLDAIKAAGVEDNTIVIWLSDNAAAPTAGPTDTRAGFNGPFRGELGDALEGSIRTVGMIKWPGRIAPRASNEMVSVHDFFPTLAGIIGAQVPIGPADRRRGSERVLHGQAAEIQPRKPDHLHRRRGRGGALARIPHLPEAVRASGGNPAMDGLGGYANGDERLSRDLQHRGGSARGGEHHRH